MKKSGSFWKNLAAVLTGGGLLALGGLVPVTAPWALPAGGGMLLAAGSKLLADKKPKKTEPEDE